MREQIKRLQSEAIFTLLCYNKRTRKQHIKNMLKKVMGRIEPPEDLIFWPTALVANALAENYEIWEEKERIVMALKAYFDRWIKRRMPIYHIDDVLCGVALIDLYKITNEEKYKDGANKMANHLYTMGKLVSDEKGSIPYRPSQKNFHVYVDGIGMMCPFLSKYSAEFGDSAAMHMAVTQIMNMLRYGMDEKTYLPYHGYDYKNNVKHGIIGWGRAVGWLLSGMASTLCFLPEEHADHDRIEKAFKMVINNAFSYQKESGAFSWQLGAMEGPEDSSATAMIVQATFKGIRTGILDKGMGVLEKKLGKAADFLAGCEKNGEIYSCLGECAGFSQYPQIYGAYPWSLGPGLEVLLFS
jgi:rhamnogalacturonyl hydrolase YesR